MNVEKLAVRCRESVEKEFQNLIPHRIQYKRVSLDSLFIHILTDMNEYLIIMFIHISELTNV